MGDEAFFFGMTHQIKTIWMLRVLERFLDHTPVHPSVMEYRRVHAGGRSSLPSDHGDNESKSVQRPARPRRRACAPFMLARTNPTHQGAVVWLCSSTCAARPLAWATTRQWETVTIGPCQRPSPSCVDPSVALDPARMRLLTRLQARAHGPGVVYTVKLMLPWLLTRFHHAIVLDFDLWPATPDALPRLAEQFNRFRPEEYVGLAEDVAARALYPGSPLGANGGVQLMRLSDMRDGDWGQMLDNFTGAVGYLGDQTVYAGLSSSHPHRFHRLSCRFNRQLNTHFHLPVSAYMCSSGCLIVHGNHPKFKRAVQQALVSGSFDPLNSTLPPRLRRAFRDCAPRAGALLSTSSPPLVDRYMPRR